MSDTRLINDAARDLAKAVVRIFASLLRDEEMIDAFREVYDLTKVHLEHFVLTHRHELRRLAALPTGEPKAPTSPDVKASK